MRRIICRFQDGPTFLKHIRLPADRRKGALTFSFLGEFGLLLDETVRVAIILDQPGERHDLHLSITGRRPANGAEAGTRGARWRYDAVATAADSVWLEMLTAKCATFERVTQNRAA